MRDMKRRWVGLAGLLVLVLIFALNHQLRGSNLVETALWRQTAWTWFATVVLLVVFVGLIGVVIAGRPAGVIIDNRNRISLSKFQALAWTLLILATLITMAAARLKADGIAALDIRIPPELLAAMGLAAASLVATPVILSAKANTPSPSSERLAEAEAGTGTPRGQGAAVGAIYSRENAAAANWLDIFRGEEISNAGAPDLSKIQQFLVSGVLVCVYGAMVWNDFANGAMLGAKGHMPALDENFIWLLGISHASYLAYKAAPHGPREPEPPGAAGADSEAVG